MSTSPLEIDCASQTRKINPFHPGVWLVWPPKRSNLHRQRYRISLRLHVRLSLPTGRGWRQIRQLLTTGIPNSVLCPLPLGGRLIKMAVLGPPRVVFQDSCFHWLRVPLKKLGLHYQYHRYCCCVSYSSICSLLMLPMLAWRKPVLSLWVLLTSLVQQ